MSLSKWTGRTNRNLAIVAALALFMNVPASAGDAVPFKMTLNLITTGIAPDAGACGSDGLLVSIVGNGNATELGRFTDAQHHCIYTNSLVFDHGSFVFTAANGDLVVGSYHGVLVPTSTSGVFEVQGHWTISGGTGRFANATGAGVASGPLNAQSGLVNLELTGTISHPTSG